MATAVTSTPHPEETLNTGIFLEEELKLKIIRLADDLFTQDVDTATFYSSLEHHNVVFSLDEKPEFIFTMQRDYSRDFVSYPSLTFPVTIRSRYECRIVAEAACKISNLSLIVIPRTQLFTITIEGKKHDVLASEKINFSVEQAALHKRSPVNAALAKQLAIFLAYTGFADFSHQHAPILPSGKVAIINCRRMSTDPILGLVDSDDGEVRGLLDFVGNENIHVETALDFFRITTLERLDKKIDQEIDRLKKEGIAIPEEVLEAIPKAKQREKDFFLKMLEELLESV
jgi:hypothetical protein